MVSKGDKVVYQESASRVYFARVHALSSGNLAALELLGGARDGEAVTGVRFDPQGLQGHSWRELAKAK